MKDNKKNKAYTIERLKSELNASYYVFFDLHQFHRKFRKYFKFSIIRKNHKTQLYLKLLPWKLQPIYVDSLKQITTLLVDCKFTTMKEN